MVVETNLPSNKNWEVLESNDMMIIKTRLIIIYYYNYYENRDTIKWQVSYIRNFVGV